VKEILLNGVGWQAPDDFYDAFLAHVEAPSWHGRNFNGLRDSIIGGQINGIEVPYRIVIRGHEAMAPAAQRVADDFADLVRELALKRCPIEISVEARL
jgi:hypothetical protein